MKNITMLVGGIILFFNLFGCKDNPVDNNINFDNIAWTADTLAYPESYQTSMYSIWGTASNNLYTCGHNERGYGKIWKYNGVEWKDINPTQELGGVVGDFLWMFGFSSTNIWVVGEAPFLGTENPARLYSHPLIIKYNGYLWTVEHLGKDTAMVTDIHGTSTDNLWACGTGGLLFNYKKNTNKWEMVQIFNNIKEQKEFNFNSIKTDENNIYLFGTKYDSQPEKTSSYFLILKNNKITHIDSFKVFEGNYKWGYKGYISSAGTLYSTGFGSVFKWNNNTWTKIFQDSYGVVRLKEINGSLIALGVCSSINVQTGDIWKKISTPYDDLNTVYSDIWSDGKKIFIVGNLLSGYPQKTIVLQSK